MASHGDISGTATPSGSSVRFGAGRTIHTLSATEIESRTRLSVFIFSTLGLRLMVAEFVFFQNSLNKKPASGISHYVLLALG
jgi:hypothetical protein